MSDIHVLEKRGGEHRLVFHFAVAAGDNDVPAGAGGLVTWQEAVAASLGGSPASVLPDGGAEAGGGGKKGAISSEELAQVASGAVMERSYSFPVDSGGTTDAERATSLRAFYAQKKAEVTAEIAKSLGYYGGILDEV